MKKVKRLSIKQESYMPEEEYTQYLKMLRAKDEKSWMNTINFGWRMRLHWILHILISGND